jgi:hypothetical protein
LLFDAKSLTETITFSVIYYGYKKWFLMLNEYSKTGISVCLEDRYFYYTVTSYI